MSLVEAFESSESIVALLSADDGRFIDINPAFEKLTGYARADVIGKMPIDIGMWSDLEFRAQLWESLRVHRRVVDAPAEVRCADGKLLAGRLHVELLRRASGNLLFCLLQILPEHHKLDEGSRRESLYRDLFLSASEGIYRSLPEGGFLDANPAMARILGFDSAEELLQSHGKRARDIYVDQESDQLENERLLELGRIDQARVQVYRRDGSRIWVSENARVIRDRAGAPIFFEGTLEDITAQVEAEQALAQSQNLYQVLLDNSRDGVFLIQRGIVRFANPAMSSMLGYQQGELIGIPYMDLVDERDVPAQESRRREREAGSRELQMYEITMIARDGRRVLCEVRADAVDYQGDIASTGTLRDVTEERKSQRALVEAERRYRELFEDSPVGLFRSSLDGEISEVNPAMAAMLGFSSPEALKQRYGSMLEVYADPSERQLLVERALHDGAFSHHETRVLDIDGNTRWVSTNVRLTRDEAGRPAHFTGSALDVQDRREMQQALVSSENKYRTLVEQSHVGVFILDHARIVYANQALCEMLGFSSDQLIGKTYGDILAPETLEEGLPIRESANDTADLTRDFESCLLHRNGQRVYAQVSVWPVQVDGRRHLTGTIIDITRQREAESRLRFHANHDPLTGLPNRALFNRMLGERLTPDDRRGRFSYAVLYLDLDGFKWVNDSLGHGAGDRLLLEIARRLEDELAPEVMIARYGGDEFTLLPEGPCDYERAVSVAKRVLSLFERPFSIGGQQVFSAVSLGIVLGRMREACRQLALWRHQRPDWRTLVMNVNVDERQMGSPELTEDVFHLLQNYKLPPSCLRLEVTESVFRSGSHHAREQLEALKALGVGLAVDDFGTGYSSLEAFAASSFDALKVDQSFVRDVHINPRHRAIVKTITGFAKDLGLLLTAEGIETDEQRQLLLELGCEFGQGKLFAMAMPAKEFEQRL
ncbi:MAG: PAS domain S-box protein [Gammaproteobacteria bacterium]|nr:PAS domain S-box protein [Gammaproteobacteria bacterium]